MEKSSNASERIELADLRYLFAFLARDRELFLAARRRLDSDKFDKAQESYQIFWEQVVVYYNKWKVMPTMAQLKSTIIAYLDEIGGIGDADEDVILELLELAETITIKQRAKRRDAVRTTLRKFLDLNTAKQVSAILSEGGNMREALQLGQAQAIANTTVETARSKDWFASFDEAIAEAAVIQYRTGMQLVDELTNGGPRSGEVLLHMGAINSGKTTLAVDVAVSRAKLELKTAKKEGRRNRYVYFYCYEESRQVYAQILCRASSVSSASIQEYLETQDSSCLSTMKKKNYKPYEAKWRRIGSEAPKGEYERLQDAFKLLQKCMVFVSMSSEDPANLELSGNYVDGLVEHFDTDRLTHNRLPDLVVLDHASAMVERHMMLSGKRDDARRHLLRQLAMSLRDRIAAPNRIPIWCLHQLGSEENKKPPGVVPDAASGAECRMMHEFFSFSLQSSKVTEPDKIGVIALGKKRRMKGADHIPFRIDGDMARWADARSTHTIYGNRVRKNEDISPLVTATGNSFTPSRRIR